MVTDRPTDQPTDIATYRAAIAAKKSNFSQSQPSRLGAKTQTKHMHVSAHMEAECSHFTLINLRERVLKP